MRNPEINIYFNRIKMALLLSLSMLVICGIILLLVFPPDVIFTFYEVQTIGTIFILSFTYGFFVMIIKFVKNKPAITLNENGLILNNNSFSKKFIKWNEIINIETEDSFEIKYIVIELINPTEFIEAEKNIFKRKGMKLNYKQYGSPICFSTTGLKLLHEDILQLLIENFYKYKG